MSSTEHIGFMLFLLAILTVTAAVTYRALARRSAGRHRADRLHQPAAYWRMKAKACEAEWTASHAKGPQRDAA